MQRRSRFTRLSFSIAAGLSAFAGLSAAGPASAQPAAECERDAAHAFDLTLLHTNDLHSTFVGASYNAYFTETTGDGDPVRGHYARLAHLIQSTRAQKELVGEPALLVDAGDFYAGTLFHILGPNPAHPYAPEFDFFAYTGFDAVTLGNHEFDAGFDGLLNMLSKNESLGLDVPLVSTNAVWPASYDRANYAELVAQVRPYLVKDVTHAGNCLRVGILGLMGPNASDVSRTNRGPAAFIGFDDAARENKMNELVTVTQDVVDELRADHDVDLVVLLTHAGAPEDATLAEELSGVDVIVAGHTHQAYPAPRVVDGVFIAQTGEYANNLGPLELTITGNQVALRNPEDALLIVDDSVPADSGIQGMIQTFATVIDDSLGATGYALDTPVFESDIDIPDVSVDGSPMGRFVTTKIQSALSDELARDADLYITGAAMVRTGIERINGQRTSFQFSDVFQLLPLGFTAGYEPGHEVVTFYLSKWELRLLFELMDLYADSNPIYTLAYSDAVSYRVRSWGIPFINRLADLKLNGKSFWGWPKLIKIGTNRFVADNLTKIADITNGIVKLQPKDANGDAIIPTAATPNKEFVLFTKAMDGTVLTTAD